jgi:uncharacterized protein YraI
LRRGFTAKVTRDRAKEQRQSKRAREVSMMDVLMIAIALGFFALAIAYAYAIENG